MHSKYTNKQWIFLILFDVQKFISQFSASKHHNRFSGKDLFFALTITQAVLNSTKVHKFQSLCLYDSMLSIPLSVYCLYGPILQCECLFQIALLSTPHDFNTICQICYKKCAVQSVWCDLGCVLFYSIPNSFSCYLWAQILSSRAHGLLRHQETCFHVLFQFPHYQLSQEHLFVFYDFQIPKHIWFYLNLLLTFSCQTNISFYAFHFCPPVRPAASPLHKIFVSSARTTNFITSDTGMIYK